MVENPTAAGNKEYSVGADAVVQTKMHKHSSQDTLPVPKLDTRETWNLVYMLLSFYVTPPYGFIITSRPNTHTFSESNFHVLQVYPAYLVPRDMQQNHHIDAACLWCVYTTAYMLMPC